MNINSNKLIQDYNALLAEKEQALAEQLQQADAIIQERITQLIPEIESCVKGEIENMVNDEYADRLGFYEQYLDVSIQDEATEPQKTEPEIKIVSPAPSNQEIEQTPQPKFSLRPKLPFMSR